MSPNIALPHPAPDFRSGGGPARQQELAILLVNDDPGVLFALRTVLSDLEVDIVTAASGEQALLRLLKQEFCLILMDVKMAGLDGFETARLVRSRPRTRDTPIVFLTSHRASDLDRTLGYEVGASDYLFMPVAPELLKAKVQAFVDGAKSRLLARQSDLEEATLSHALERELEHDSGRHAAPGAWLAPPQLAQDELEGTAIERLILEHTGDYVALLDASGAWLYTSPSYRAEFGAAIQPGARYLEIVHVDDRERVRDMLDLTGLLENAGMEVNAVGSGDEALRQLDTHPGIDIVLMDIMMPDMDGYETTRLIRADPRFARLPVIALTAKAMLEDRAKCIAAGASDYASKPVDTEQLLGLLRVWLGG